MALLPEIKVDFTPLVQSVPNSVGIIFNWVFGKRVSRSRAAQMLIDAKAEREARLIRDGKLDIDEDGNIVNFEQMQQDNIQESIEFAVQEALLKSREQEGSKQNFSEDTSQTFFNHWREYVKNIDEVEVKKLWGKLLASEACEPNSISLRLLNEISMMSKYEMATFVQSLPYIVEEGFIVVDFVSEDLKGTLFNTLYDMGLIVKIPSAIREVSRTRHYKNRNLNYFYIHQRNRLIAFHAKSSSDEDSLSLEVIALTSLGRELYKIADEDKDEYVKLFESIDSFKLNLKTINRISIYKMENNTVTETLLEKDIS